MAKEIYERYESWLPEGVSDLASWFESLVSQAGLASLSELSVSESNLPKLANAATQQWTGKFNPREVGQTEFERLYGAALGSVAKRV